MMEKEKNDRRDFLKYVGTLIGGLVIGAAGGYFLAPPKIVEKTVEVEKPVVVEKPVTPPPKEIPTVKIYASPSSSIPLLVAAQEGFAEEEGVKLDVSTVGYAEEAKLFMTRQADVGVASPWEAADMRNEGLDVTFFSNAGAVRFFNSMFVRAEDYPKYSSPKDLVGKTIGIPGWGTGTTQAFQVVAQYLWGIDVKKEFDLKVAEPAALIGMLEQGQVEANLLFSGQTLASLANPKFKRIFSFADTWEEKTGFPLTITGLVAYRDWLKENPETAKAIHEASIRAIKWIALHPEEFVEEGGKYYKNGEKVGWTRDRPTKDLVKEWLRLGKYYYFGYTPAWIEAQWAFIETAKEVGVIIEKLPEKDKTFRTPAEWPGVP
jgi:NitT/TauT family transport system substrate-binding protein